MRAVRWLLLLLSGFTVQAHACSCAGPISACSSYWTTPAVFHGTVLEKKVVRPPAIEGKRPDGTTFSIMSPGIVQVRLSIKEGFRGVDGKSEITVTTNERGRPVAITLKPARIISSLRMPAKMANSASPTAA